jgi:hypothetical protein
MGDHILLLGVREKKSSPRLRPGYDPAMSDDVRIQHFAKALKGWERKARTLHRTVREQSRFTFYQNAIKQSRSEK